MTTQLTHMNSFIINSYMLNNKNSLFIHRLNILQCVNFGQIRCTPVILTWTIFEQPGSFIAGMIYVGVFKSFQKLNKSGPQYTRGTLIAKSNTFLISQGEIPLSKFKLFLYETGRYNISILQVTKLRKYLWELDNPKFKGFRQERPIFCH